MCPIYGNVIACNMLKNAVALCVFISVFTCTNNNNALFFENVVKQMYFFSLTEISSILPVHLPNVIGGIFCRHISDVLSII